MPPEHLEAEDYEELHTLLLSVSRWAEHARTHSAALLDRFPEHEVRWGATWAASCADAVPSGPALRTALRILRQAAAAAHEWYERQDTLVVECLEERSPVPYPSEELEAVLLRLL